MYKYANFMEFPLGEVISKIKIHHFFNPINCKVNYKYCDGCFIKFVVTKKDLKYENLKD